jgi:hypothetical protein
LSLAFQSANRVLGARQTTTDSRCENRDVHPAFGTAVLLVVSLTAAGIAPAQPTPQLLWALDLNGDRNVVAIGWSPTGS